MSSLVPGRHLRLVAAAATLALAGAAAGCGSSDSGDNAASGGGKKLNVAVVAAGASDPYMVSVQCGAAAEAKQLGVGFKWSAPATFDVPKEVSALNSIKITRPDGIVLVPMSPTAFVAPVKSLMQSGTPVTLADSDLAEPVAHETFHTDNLAAGTSLSDEIAKSSPKGKLGIIASTAGDPIDSSRYTGLIAALKRDHPDIQALTPQYANFSTTKAASQTAALIRANPDLTAVYATNGPQAAGVVSAVAAAKAQDRVKVYSFDATPEEVDGLRAGKIQALVAQSPYSMGQQALASVVKQLRSGDAKPVPVQNPNLVKTPHMVLTKENVDSTEAKPFLYIKSCN